MKDFFAKAIMAMRLNPTVADFLTVLSLKQSLMKSKDPLTINIGLLI